MAFCNSVCKVKILPICRKINRKTNEHLCFGVCHIISNVTLNYQNRNNICDVVDAMKRRENKTKVKNTTEGDVSRKVQGRGKKQNI